MFALVLVALVTTARPAAQPTVVPSELATGRWQSPLGTTAGRADLIASLRSAAPPAAPGSIDEGIALYQSLQFEKATIAFQRLVLKGDVPPPTKAQAFLWLGLSYGQLGDTDAAKSSFQSAMDIDTTLKPPDDTPPALLTMLEQERTAAQARAAPTTELIPTLVKDPPPPPPSTTPNIAAIGSGIGAGVLAIAAIGVGGFGAEELVKSYDINTTPRDSLSAYDNAVTCGVVAGILGSVAAVAGGVSAVMFVLE